MPINLTFWGVRGSTPTPVAENLEFGGNTTCIEIQCGDSRVIVDAGSGIRELGRQLANGQSPEKVEILLTHFHWDHIQGLPFFAPLMRPGNKITFRSFPADAEIRSRLERQMSDPYFTLDFNRVAAEREFCQVEKEFRLGTLAVKTFPLNHPQGAVGYRVEADGKAIVVATDFEHGNNRLDETLRQFSEGADVLIYDAQYSPDEYESRKGWGHSTYREAASVARDAKVGKLVLFHHDPMHHDAAMKELLKDARRFFENTIAAKEQQTFSV